MVKPKLLSISIPTYNRAKYCKETIENLASQIKEDGLQDEVEINVSNNCSTDSTAEMLKLLKNKYNNILNCYEQQENIGAGKNMLFLLNKCSAEYIQFCSDDDIYDKNMIKNTLKILKDEKPALIYLNCRWKNLPFKKSVDINNDFIGVYGEVLEKIGWGITHISPVVIKSNLIKEIPYMHDEWILPQKMVLINPNKNAYIMSNPDIEARCAEGETHWTQKPQIKNQYFLDMIEFCVKKRDEIFYLYNAFVITSCCELGINNLFCNNLYPKFKKYKHGLKFMYFLSVLLFILLVISIILRIFKCI